MPHSTIKQYRKQRILHNLVLWSFNTFLWVYYLCSSKYRLHLSFQIYKTVEATSEALKNMYKQWDSEMSKIASGKTDAAAGVSSCQSIKNSSDDLELYYLSVSDIC